MPRERRFAVAGILLLVPACSTGSDRWKEPYAEYFTPAVRVYFDIGEDEDDELDIFEDGSLSPAVDFLGLNWPFLARAGVDEAAAQDEVDRLQEQARDKRRKADSARTTLNRARDVASDPARAGDPQAAADLSNAEANFRGLDMEASDQEKRAAKARDQKDRAGGTRLDGDWILGPRLAIGMTSPASDAEDGTEASGAPVVYFSAGLVADFQQGTEVGDEGGFGVRLEAGFMYGVSSDESLADADDSAIFVGMTVQLR